MTNEVKIIFSDDVLVTENSAVKNFVENQKAGHCSLIIKDEQYVIVKTDDKKKSLEKVRSTAGISPVTFLLKKLKKLVFKELHLKQLFLILIKKRSLLHLLKVGSLALINSRHINRMLKRQKQHLKWQAI
ncbi:hypothetical protein QNH10_10315 [Sporosarcina thermotolerans]|uniref:hypothetical protein n=1 Tax=Sporosarcina thermotolerans TaxID=633404 RepID=UPI0024BCD4FA|nr:hypothetical protein [Sporosarcina thermotolerans]WHT49803.1 hypothetical protein QNH10_10315 [Sporosarcina thermotolerans]